LTELVYQSIQHQIGSDEGNFDESHYPILNIISQDAYLFYEDETAGLRKFSGIVYGHKQVHQNGMNEMIIAQEEINGERKKWKRFLFTSSDPNGSITNLFDRVPRRMIDERASRRLYYSGFAILGSIIVLLLSILLFNIEIDPTYGNFFGAAGIITTVITYFAYQLKLMGKDVVDTCKIFDDAPPIVISRSYIHPYNSEIKRFSGEVPVIFVKSQKVTFSAIRGYSVSQMAVNMDYAAELDHFRNEVAQVQLELYNELEHAKKGEEKAIKNKYENAISELKEITLHKLYKKHSDLVSSGDMTEIIQMVRSKMADAQFRLKVADEVHRHTREKEDVFTKLTQTEIERDDYKKDAAAWKRKANQDLNKQGEIVAIKLAHILQNKANFESYVSPDLPNRTDSFDTNFKSAILTLFPVIIAVFVFILVGNWVGSALRRMGQWALIVFVLFAFIVIIAILWFAFTYAKNYFVDKANRTTGVSKVRMA